MPAAAARSPTSSRRRVGRLAAVALDRDRRGHERELHGLPRAARRRRGPRTGRRRTHRPRRSCRPRGPAPPAARCPRAAAPRRAAPRVSTTRGGQVARERVELGLVDDRDVERATRSGSIALGGEGLTTADARRRRAPRRACPHAPRAGSRPGRTRPRRRTALGAPGRPLAPGQREDLILALRVDGDQRDAAVHSRDHGERRDVDALVLERAADERRRTGRRRARRRSAPGAPRRAAATATFAPLPPGASRKRSPSTDSPGPGRRGA